MTLDYCIKKGKEALSACTSKPPSFHYAVVTDAKGRVIGESENLHQKSHPLQAKYARLSGNPHKQFCHAEIRSLIRAMKKGKPHTIYITRIGKRGNVMYSAPCEVCSMMIKEVGVKVVVYTTGE